MIQYYLDKVTSQHQKPKFLAWLTVGLWLFKDISSVDINSSFEMDNATGVQLDIVGQILGRSRILPFQPLFDISPVMDDTVYRLVLKAKVLQNQWDGTIPGIYEIWDVIFPNVDLYITDNQNMTMKATVIGMHGVLEQQLISNGYIVPKPATVGILYEFAENVDMNIYYGFVVQEGTIETVIQGG